MFDPTVHYNLGTGPVAQYGSAAETPPNIRNIGWTLGNDCPYRCTHCYSMTAREKGKNLEKEMIDRIVSELASIGVETVNLGGNEPLFTNGLNPQKTLLPYIIRALVERNIEVGLTTSGITLLYLYRHHTDAFDLLNDVDISLDSPFAAEHDRNRGAALYNTAISSLALCAKEQKLHTIIMAAMNWNFTAAHIDALVGIAKRYSAFVRINPIKPVEPEHRSLALPVDMYYKGFAHLMELCDPVDLGEPPIAAVSFQPNPRRCPCGRTSFRIHSISPDGCVYVSPCVYLHDYKSPLEPVMHFCDRAKL